MISFIILLLACIFKSFWLILVAYVVHDFFYYQRVKEIKELRERIEELEDEINKKNRGKYYE